MYEQIPGPHGGQSLETSGPWSGRLGRWVDSFVPEEGCRPDVVLKQRMLVISSVVLAGVAVAFGAHAWQLQGKVGPISVSLWTGAVLALSAPSLLRATRSVVLPGALICIEFALLLGIVALFGNGFNGAVLLWAPAVPLLTAFLVGARAAIGLALWMSIEVGILFWLDSTGAGIPDRFEPVQVERLRLVALVSGVGLATFLGWLYESQTLRGLRRVNRELAAAQERAEASERVKRTLLANMSHEVRTPMTVIMGAAELLREDAPDELAELADMVLAGSRRMLHTLTAVLDLTYLDGEAFVFQPEPFDLVQCVRQAVEAAGPAAARKGLTIEMDSVPAGGVVASADPALTRRVLDLLLDNAVKFTASGGITVRVDPGADVVRVDIVDTGVGMAETFVPYAFDAFQQESEGLARSYEGAGLGLTVAHRLALLQAGTLTVASRKGEGSTFSLGLPLASAEAVPPVPRTAVAA